MKFDHSIRTCHCGDNGVAVKSTPIEQKAGSTVPERLWRNTKAELLQHSVAINVGVQCVIIIRCTRRLLRDKFQHQLLHSSLTQPLPTTWDVLGRSRTKRNLILKAIFCVLFRRFFSFVFFAAASKESFYIASSYYWAWIQFPGFEFTVSSTIERSAV